MTAEAYYGDAYPGMKAAEAQTLALLNQYAAESGAQQGLHPIVYCCSRIKRPESMTQKLRGRDLAPTAENALRAVHDAIGVRAICAFADDVMQLVAWLRTQPALTVLKEKNYYEYPKPNGYRSYHLICQVPVDGTPFFVEIQIRTIANDFWATLEHQLKYKKALPNEALIRSELKRCADEIASVDLSMQTIRDILNETK